MTKIKFEEYNGKYYELNCYKKPLSIYDIRIGGRKQKCDYTEDKEPFYIILGHAFTEETYCIKKEDFYNFLKGGKILEPGKVGSFYGETSIGMTYEEEMKYNMDDHNFYVDFWGNRKY